MPFDEINGVVYGDDARMVVQWARTTFCVWLASKLNDSNGPYADALGITTERRAVVTDNSAEAKAKYAEANSPPVVFVMQGPVDSRRRDIKISGQRFDGQRHEITLEMDMGVNDRTPDDDNETDEIRDDSRLASFVSDAVEKGLSELDARGLYNSELAQDEQKQRAGEGRYPHKLTFFCLSVSDWAPGII